jgi:hypothetical protein
MYFYHAQLGCSSNGCASLDWNGHRCDILPIGYATMCLQLIRALPELSRRLVRTRGRGAVNCRADAAFLRAWARRDHALHRCHRRCQAVDDKGRPRCLANESRGPAIMVWAGKGRGRSSSCSMKGRLAPEGAVCYVTRLAVGIEVTKRRTIQEILVVGFAILRMR